jgi:sugar/nucleoside kinase (ribokinase family)
VDAVDEELSMRAARLARDAGVTVTSDIDTVTGRTRDLLAAVTVPIVAEHVATELTGDSDLERALRGFVAITRAHCV